MDRWYSHTPCGQECAQILAQWVWNASSENWDNSSLHLSCARPNLLPRMRLNLLQPMSLNLQQHRLTQSRLVQPLWARSSFTHGCAWLRIYAATRWKPPLPCQPSALSKGSAPRARWHLTTLVCRTHWSMSCLPVARTVSGEQHHAGSTTEKSRCFGRSPLLTQNPRRHLAQPLLPLLLLRCKGSDWPRCSIRRIWLNVVRSQTVCLDSSAPLSPPHGPCSTEKILTRAERAHWRLSWDQRLARNARPADAPRLIVTLHGLPATFATAFGFDLLATA